MKEDTELRFYLARKLIGMPYGGTELVPGYDAARAWPPTGDHDRSIEGAMRALALAAGGNRPESSYTTKERIIRDLDDSFDAEQRFDGDWEIHRRLSCCPTCRGSGVYKAWLPSDDDDGPDISAELPMTATVKVSVLKCNHKPQG